MKEIEFVSKVIFCEAVGTSFYDMYLVASVIRNRIDNIGFAKGRLKSMFEVVSQPGAFSCINDSKNSNWVDFGTNAVKYLDRWKYCLELASENFNFAPDIVYYHDHSIGKPSSWDNKYFSAVKVIETKHFTFYKIQEV